MFLNCDGSAFSSFRNCKRVPEVRVVGARDDVSTLLCCGGLPSWSWVRLLRVLGRGLGGFPTFAGFRSFFLPTMIDTPASFFTFLGKNTFVLVSDVLIKYCFCVMMTAMEKKSGLQKQETELNLPTPPLDLRHVFRKIVFFLFRQRRSVSFIS